MGIIAHVRLLDYVLYFIFSNTFSTSIIDVVIDMILLSLSIIMYCGIATISNDFMNLLSNPLVPTYRCLPLGLYFWIV